MVFNETNIQKPISKLNCGKSADEYGIQAEHRKSAGCHMVPLLVTQFNDIVSNGEAPESFKSGILTPVHKKDKDPTFLSRQRHYCDGYYWQGFRVCFT